MAGNPGANQASATGELRFSGTGSDRNGTVRDFLTEDVERIVVDSPKACDGMRAMIAKISKRSANKVKLYSEPQPIFDRFNITRQLENAFFTPGPPQERRLYCRG